MGNLATAWAQVHPSRVEPGVLMQINQASQAMRIVGGGGPSILLDAEDLLVYMRYLRMRARTQSAQTEGNLVPGAELEPGYISTATYRIRTQATWDHHESANMSRWGINIVEGYRYANRQGHFQTLRNYELYGFNPANNEGFVNAQNVTSVNLPVDTFGNQTVRTYDNGQLAVWFLTQVVNLKNRTYQLGQPRRISILGPQRVIGQMESINIVQLTSFQRIGAGSMTTGQMIEAVLKDTQGDVIEFCYDDTLIGQGQGGSDLVIMQLSEVEQPNFPEWNTNEFALLEPNLAACALQYADRAAPLEITVPLIHGAQNTLYEMRATCGWPVRPEGTTLLSMPY